MMPIYLVLAAGAIGLISALALAILVIRQDAGNETVRGIAALIQEGAMAFLRREYTILAIFVAIIFVVLTLFIDFNVLGVDKINELGERGRLDINGPWTALAYLAGAIGSGLAGFIGMSIAVRGNSRTAAAPKIIISIFKALIIQPISSLVKTFSKPPKRYETG